MRNCDGVVGIASRLTTGQSGVRIPTAVRDFYLLRNVQTATAAHLGLLLKGYRGSFAGVNRAGREVNYSSPSSVEVKNEYVFMTWARAT